MLLTEYDEKKQWELVYNEGVEKGREEGREEERVEISRLIDALLATGRVNDIKRVISDTVYRDQLLNELQIT